MRAIIVALAVVFAASAQAAQHEECPPPPPGKSYVCIMPKMPKQGRLRTAGEWLHLLKEGHPELITIPRCEEDPHRE